MPRKDKTFNQFDLIRFWRDNLTKEEQDSFIILFNQMELDDATDFCLSVRRMVDLGGVISSILTPLSAFPGLKQIIALWFGYIEALQALERLLCGRR